MKKEKDNPNFIKDYFFSRTDPSIFTSNKKSLVFPVLQSASHFLPPVHSVSQIRFKFSSHLQLLLQIRCLIALRAESSIVRANSNITDTIIRKVISIQQEKCRTNNGALRNSYVLIFKKTLLMKIEIETRVIRIKNDTLKIHKSELIYKENKFLTQQQIIHSNQIAQ